MPAAHQLQLIRVRHLFVPSTSMSELMQSRRLYRVLCMAPHFAKMLLLPLWLAAYSQVTLIRAAASRDRHYVVQLHVNVSTGLLSVLRTLQVLMLCSRMCYSVSASSLHSYASISWDSNIGATRTVPLRGGRFVCLFLGVLWRVAWSFCARGRFDVSDSPPDGGPQLMCL